MIVKPLSFFLIASYPPPPPCTTIKSTNLCALLTARIWFKLELLVRSVSKVIAEYVASLSVMMRCSYSNTHLLLSVDRFVSYPPPPCTTIKPTNLCALLTARMWFKLELIMPSVSKVVVVCVCVSARVMNMDLYFICYA